MIHIGVELFREQAVGAADLRIGAMAVEAEDRVMVWFGGLQLRKTRKSSAIAPRPSLWPGIKKPSFQSKKRERQL